jgi:hypothetical protein
MHCLAGNRYKGAAQLNLKPLTYIKSFADDQEFEDLLPISSEVLEFAGSLRQQHYLDADTNTKHTDIGRLAAPERAIRSDGQRYQWQPEPLMKPGNHYFGFGSRTQSLKSKTKQENQQSKPSNGLKAQEMVVTEPSKPV